MQPDVPEQSLLDAIYGGPTLKVTKLRQFIRKRKIPLPGNVVAYPDNTAFTHRKESSKETITLRLHAGIVYRLSPAKYDKPPFPKNYYARPQELITAIQQAILSLRGKELEKLDQTLSPQAGERDGFTLQEEGEAFRMAVQAIFKNPDTADSAVDIWGRIMLHRRQRYLYSIHLKLIELITALTHGQDLYQAYPYYALIVQILSTYSLSELAKFPRRIMREIGPLIEINQHEYRSTHIHSTAVKKAVAFMNDTFTEHISLDHVAKASYVSAAHLSRVFKQETGWTVVEHLQHLRINHAMHLLSTGSQSLLEIAFDSGFESIEHFHRLFRRFTGTTPRKYRLQSQNIFIGNPIEKSII